MSYSRIRSLSLLFIWSQVGFSAEHQTIGVHLKDSSSLNVVSAEEPIDELNSTDAPTPNEWTDPLYNFTWVYVGEFSFETAKKECERLGHQFPRSDIKTAKNNPVLDSLVKAMRTSPMSAVIPEAQTGIHDYINGGEITKSTWIISQPVWELYRDGWELAGGDLPHPSHVNPFVSYGPAEDMPGYYRSGYGVDFAVKVMSTISLKTKDDVPPPPPTL
jgi:hypothetical protein